MTCFEKSPALSRDLRSTARQFLGSRTGLIMIAAAVLGLGAYSSWGWLVAAGIAPLLLTFAPCAAMCAIGMCTTGGRSKTANDVTSSGSVSGTDTKAPLSLAAPGSDKASVKSDKGCC